MRVLAGIAGVCALGLALTGCATTQEEWPPANGVVTREQFEERGLTWPLTVDKGTLRCVDEAIVILVDGKVYGLTGFAKARGAQPIDPVWADNTELAKEIEEAGGDISFIPKISLYDLTSVGQELC